MAFSRRIFCLWLALLLGAGSLEAATATREQRAYDNAVAAFHDHLWNVAELDFADFAVKFPNSELVPQAGLLQAQAVIKQGRFGDAEVLLAALRPKAGKLFEDCTYWLGEAQFQGGTYQSAEATLASVSTNSPLALQATVEAGVAMARLGQWPQLVKLFQDDQGLFQSAEQTDADNEMLLRGRLLLAQADFAQKLYPAAASLLVSIKPAILPPELEWQRLYLLCQVDVAEGELERALPLATDVEATARRWSGAGVPVDLPAAVALRATVLEGLGRGTEAMATYGENLTTNAPEGRQRQAILKISALSIDRHEYTNAEVKLNDYVTQFTNAPALDVAWLTLGELYLHDYISQPGSVGLLAAARAWLDELLTVTPNSPFAGKASLDRGWCGWLAGDYADCLTDFQSAVAKLPLSEDLAVARFKLADTFFARGDYADALNNYQAVLHFADGFPEVVQALGDQALYQSLRAQLHLGDLAGAAGSMDRIARAYPESELRQSGALLLGEGYTDLRQPTNALAVFTNFLGRVPNSPLRAPVELAIARAYEQEQNWPAVIAQYESWLQEFPTNDLYPQAKYSRAWASFQAGDETNALTMFTNFVVQYPTNDLAPMAQWWEADHYFRLGDFKDAWLSYKAIFQNTNWQGSTLNYPAQLMAGRAAVSRTDYAQAIRDHFEKLEDDTNCPLDLRVQATFLHGSALMNMEALDTNNPTANFSLAATVLDRICQSYPTNETGARAWGLMGNCYLQLGRYDDATNAYWQAMNYAGTNAALQNQAQIGLGIVLEKKAALLSAGPDQTALLNRAEANYWDVLQGAKENGEDEDLFWAKEAGLKAADLAVGLGKWEDATNFYGELVRLMPELQDVLARKMDAANQHLNAFKK